MKGILLWLIGIPIPIIIQLYLFGVFLRGRLGPPAAGRVPRPDWRGRVRPLYLPGSRWVWPGSGKGLMND
jgi:hypothetical protein